MLISSCQVIGHPAERQVKKMYAALSDGDTYAYMDTILPENRRQPNILGLLNAISIGIGPVRADISKIASVNISDLRVSMLYSNETYALVQAEGNVRYSILMMEIPFCDQHDVRLHSDGNWYVDVYAPERFERLERILNIREQELMEMYDGSSGYNEYDIFGELFTGMEQALNLCE